MLAFEGVRFAYPGGGEVLRGIDLRLNPGDRVVLTGRSGSGKSTLLRLAAGLIEPEAGTVVRGDGGRELTVGFVRQQPENQIVAGTVAEEIAFALEYRELPTPEIRRRVEEALEVAGLEELAFRAPGRLSGGQMQRVAFAAAWAQRPELWLLDEPTSYLDPESRSRLEALVKQIPSESALLYVASDPSDYTLTGRLVVLDNGRISADGSPEEIFASGAVRQAGLLEPRTWRLKRMMEGEGTPEVVPEGRDNVAQNDLRESSTHDRGAVHLPPRLGKERVRARDLRAVRREFLGPAREVLRGVELELCEGEVAALVGPGGAGKSTLIETLAGLLPPSGGEVLWGGRQPREMVGRVGVAFQFPERSFFAETVLEEVAYGPRNLGKSQEEARRIAVDALEALGIDPDIFGDRSPFEVSGGEARRVALAAVWALRPEAYLLDEPTAGLDEASAEAVGRLIRDEAARGCSVLIAGHDLDRFADWTDRWILLEDGRVLRDGDPRQWWADGGDEIWPAPATVRVWRETGRDVKAMPGIDWASATAGLHGSAARRRS